jgi:hypothetical protein
MILPRTGMKVGRERKRGGNIGLLRYTIVILISKYLYTIISFAYNLAGSRSRLHAIEDFAKAIQFLNPTYEKRKMR